MNTLKAAKLITCCISALTLFACSNMSKQVDVSSISTNLTGLTQDKSAEPVKVYKRPGAPGLENYKKFIIDPVYIDYDDKNIENLSPDQVNQLRSYFHSAMTSALTSAGYEVVTRSADDVLRISFMLKDLKAPTSATNLSVLVVPGLSTSVGGVTIEAIFRNAATRVIDAVVIESSSGSYMFNKKPWSNLGDIESAFDSWAEGFTDSVNKAHGKG